MLPDYLDTRVAKSLDRCSATNEGCPVTVECKSLRDYWVEQSGFARVTYERNTLAEVIFQGRFGRLLRIDAELPVQFQEALAHTHPLLEVEEGIQINFGPGQSHAPTQTKTYKFFTAEREQFISLSSNFVAVTTTRYVAWERFRETIELALNELRRIYAVTTFQRLGLRYLNLIDRGELGLENQAWSELLKPQALGWVADEDCEKWASSAQANVLFSCGSVTCQVRSGLVQSERPNSTVAFLLDADYYVESTCDGDVSNILGQLNELNSFSGPFFRWSITPALHSALGPKSAG